MERGCNTPSEICNSDQDIPQYDGNVSIESSVSASSNESNYDTDDEAFAEPMAANLFPPNGQPQAPNQPIILDIHPNPESSSNLPLCLLINARSVYNKEKNLCEMLRVIGPDLSIITETIEREKEEDMRKRKKSIQK